MSRQTNLPKITKPRQRKNSRQAVGSNSRPCPQAQRISIAFYTRNYPRPAYRPLLSNRCILPRMSSTLQPPWPSAKASSQHLWRAPQGLARPIDTGPHLVNKCLSIQRSNETEGTLWPMCGKWSFDLLFIIKHWFGFQTKKMWLAVKQIAASNSPWISFILWSL